jgi:hypothetical protein
MTCTCGDAYVSEDSELFVSLTCDSSDSRCARASRINALRRRLERERGFQLEKFAVSRSETYGFLARTSFRYHVTWPAIDAARTVTHDSGITQVFRSAFAARTGEGTPMGAYQFLAWRNAYATYAPDGSSLGDYQTPEAAYTAITRAGR